MIKNWVERRKRIHARNELFASRSKEEWKKAWDGCESKKDDSVLKYISENMELPNHYLFPSDLLSLILLNKTGDMREIEVILGVESMIGKKINPEEYEGITVGELFEG